MTENNFQIYSAAVSDRGLSEKRPQNEDSFLEMKNIGLFAVADGVGGAQAGDVASQMAMEILGEAFINLQFNGDAEEMMKIAIERANSAIFQMAGDLPQLSTMATTIVALHVSGNIATIGHVGDSRLYRVDSKGNLYRETQDHSVVEEEVRAGRMTAAQAANHPSRNVISRALGAESGVEVDMKTIMFDGNTRFLLCSDGITRHINDLELRELLLANSPPDEICARMKEICYSRGAEDNLTAVVINIARNDAAVNSPNSYTVAPINAPVNAPVVEEEPTVATARMAPAQPPPPVVEEDYEEIPTRGLEMPAAMQAPPASQTAAPTEKFSYSSDDDDEQYLMEETAPAPVPAVSQNEEIHETVEMPNTMAFAANENSVAAPFAPKPAEAPRDFTADEAPEKTGSGFFGKLLSALLLLILGAGLGVASYYIWQQKYVDQSNKPNLIPETDNIQKNSTDKLRKTGDTDPVNTIRTFENPQSLPQDSIDFYQLGRAYLLNKNYKEAIDAFIKARNGLKDVTDLETKTVLATDITQGLVIAQDEKLREKFVKELADANGVGNNSTNLNTNTNP